MISKLQQTVLSLATVCEKPYAVPRQSFAPMRVRCFHCSVPVQNPNISFSLYLSKILISFLFDAFIALYLSKILISLLLVHRLTHQFLYTPTEFPGSQGPRHKVLYSITYIVLEASCINCLR